MVSNFGLDGILLANNAYADVRRDLRGRYPRHPWPEDPFTAVAQRGVKHLRK